MKVPLPSLVVVCQEVPFPARNGGQQETWARLKEWSRLGARLHVIFWTLDRASASMAISAVEEIGCSSAALLRRRSIRSLLQTRVPPLAFSMRPDSDWYPSLREDVTRFGPTAVVLENWPGVMTAWQLATDLGVPLLYRSQNVETAYWREIVRASSGVSRLRFGMTANRIERLERSLRASASLVLDISHDDAREAELTGMLGHSVVLPPYWEHPSSNLADRQLEAAPDVDILFGGSLWPPHHVEGLRWLILEVLPRLRSKVDRRLRVRIVGARPAPEVLRLCRHHEIECLADVADFRAEVRRGRVLVNPVRRSSGINIKMLELLTSGRDVVSTSAGARGLTDEVKSRMVIADGPEEFAEEVACLLATNHRTCATDLETVVASDYGVDSQRTFLENLGRLALSPPPPPSL